MEFGNHAWDRHGEEDTVRDTGWSDLSAQFCLHLEQDHSDPECDKLIGCGRVAGKYFDLDVSVDRNKRSLQLGKC